MGNDPLNRTDPTGLTDVGGVVIWGQSDAQRRAEEQARAEAVAIANTLRDAARNAVDAITVTAKKKDKCPAGAYVTASYGGGATAAFFVALNLGVQVNISHPASVNPRNPLLGTQISITGQIAPMWGAGIYAGGGEQFGVGVSNGPSKQGFSPSANGYVEGDVGLGIGAGASGQASFEKGRLTGASGGLSGKIGTGVGAYGGVGAAFSGTYASKPFGCK